MSLCVFTYIRSQTEDNTMLAIRRSAAALLLLSAGRGSDALLTPKARGLTLEEIFSMIQSEVEFE